MNYLFEGLVVFGGAPGGTAYYIIYDAGDGKYWCKMKTWNQYRGEPMGDFPVWKEKGRWCYAGHVLIKDLILDQITTYIEEWLRASDQYKDECRKTFKYIGEAP